MQLSILHRLNSSKSKPKVKTIPYLSILVILWVFPEYFFSFVLSIPRWKKLHHFTSRWCFALRNPIIDLRIVYILNRLNKAHMTTKCSLPFLFPFQEVYDHLQRNMADKRVKSSGGRRHLAVASKKTNCRKGTHAKGVREVSRILLSSV